MQDFLKGRTFVLHRRPWWKTGWGIATIGALLLLMGAFLVLLVVSHPVPKDQGPALDEEELAKFQGVWEVIAMEKDGDPAPLDQARRSRVLTFQGRYYTWASGGRGAITRLDATCTPQEVDYVGFRGAAEVPEVGIYEFIDGDEPMFRDCFGTLGIRPTAFKTWKGSGYTMVTYRRVR